MNLAFGWRVVWLVFAPCGCAGSLAAAEFQFRHHFIQRQLPISDKNVGDYGCTALVDIDGDGDLDFVLGGRPAPPSQLYWFEFQGPDRWSQHVVGTNYLSDVGLAALDVDGDGSMDLVCSGVWYRNPGNPRQQPFERFVFDDQGAGAHDILVGDIDGDGKGDVVMMGDARTKLNALCWYSIPKDPRRAWTRHPIGPPVHGAITPGGLTDVDGDGDLDVLRADTWFENADGKGAQWIAHANIPMGRTGPFGVCVRTAVADLDGDGKAEVVMADADIVDSKIVVLRNADGKGGRWDKLPLPQTFTYGSLHALAVADMNGDGKLDIISNEQEELLPPGRTNPRWVVWENLGGFQFRERVILDAKLGGHELQVGDVDRDGDMDICSKPWGPRPWNGNGGQMHVDFLENLTRGRPGGRP
ncbi:MAG TPA: VCBS repeat-containing protein [Verrucomicrobiae bacterium]|nr:VCBS repeat-containing protein [Verrucomicrobiae bacterium]